MKTLTHRFYGWMVIGGVSATTLLGFPYFEDSPISTASDASTLNFESGGQLSAEELDQQFGAAAEDEGAAGAQEASVGIEAGGGKFRVNGQEANIYTVNIPYSRKMSERGTLLLTMPIAVVDYDNNAIIPSGAKAYGFGINAGYAWQAFLKKDNVPYRWKITPSAGLFYRDSSDLNQGAWVFNTGLSSSFAWQFSPGWVINMGNSISFAWNNGIKDYPDPVRDDQQTFVNGLQLYRMLDRWTMGVYLTDTEALNNMLVDSYQTYGVSAAYQLTKNRSVRLSLVRELGNGGYSSTRGMLGTTWKF